MRHESINGSRYPIIIPFANLSPLSGIRLHASSISGNRKIPESNAENHQKMHMKRLLFAAAGISFGLLSQQVHAQESIPDILSDPALDLSRPADRANAVRRMKAAEDDSRARAHAKARAMGIPIRVKQPGGKVSGIVGLDENGDFLIYTTENVNAAISTAANLVNASPYHLNGSGMTVGIWDGGAVRNTHQEFAAGVRVFLSSFRPEKGPCSFLPKGPSLCLFAKGLELP
jgi:hypothetical protein